MWTTPIGQQYLSIPHDQGRQTTPHIHERVTMGNFPYITNATANISRQVSTQ